MQHAAAFVRLRKLYVTLRRSKLSISWNRGTLLLSHAEKGIVGDALIIFWPDVCSFSMDRLMPLS